MPDRIPAPGPSFLRERQIHVRDRVLGIGMGRPTEDGDGGWWVALCWVADADGLVTYRDVAPLGGPPPEPPAMRLGPASPAASPGSSSRMPGGCSSGSPRRSRRSTRPGRGTRPLAVLVAIRPEPMRAAAMRPNELAEAVLVAFGRAVEGLGRP